MTARRAGALDVPVSEELLGFFVVKLLFCFDFKPALIEQGQEEILSHFVVLGRGGAAVMVEADVKACEGFLHLHVVRIDNFSGGGVLFFCTKGDRRTVFIAPTYPKHVFPHAPKVPDVDVSRQIGTSNVAEVDRPVGIRKRGSDHPPLWCVWKHSCKNTSGVDCSEHQREFDRKKLRSLACLTTDRFIDNIFLMALVEI